MSDTNSEAPIASEAVEAAKSEPVAVSATQPVAYTKPRSPINSQARFLEHSIKASMGDSGSAQYVALAKDEAKRMLTFADDSFTTNPAFKPIQYVSTVVDTSIGSRAAIDAIGSRRLGNSGMQVSVLFCGTPNSFAFNTIYLVEVYPRSNRRTFNIVSIVCPRLWQTSPFTFSRRNASGFFSLSILAIS